MSTKKYGITGYGGYIPRLRMQRAAIADAHRWMAPSLKSLAKGHRAFCSWDEDSVTMAVEAARDAIGLRNTSEFTSLFLASTTHPYADLQNSVILSSALALPAQARALDISGSQRAGTSGLITALSEGNSKTLFVASDRPRGKPGSIQEISYGAGSAAFTLGSDEVIAELVGSVSHSTMFVDHFRSSEAKYDYVWEERWIRDEGYAKLVPDAIKTALAKSRVNAKDVNHFILAAPIKGIASMIAKSAGIPPDAEVDNLEESCGFAGTAHGLMMLAQTLENAQPEQIILLVGFGQGVDVLVLRITDAITSFSPRRGISAALSDLQSHDSYLRMLSYEGSVDLEWGMRAEKSPKTPLTEQYRSSFQLSNFNAGKCPTCGTVQFPQLSYCVNPTCNSAAENFDQLSLIDVPCEVLTFTADWLSYHPSPPLYVGFTQFANGARLPMETVDVGNSGLEIGMPLKVVFRIKDVDRDRHSPRYFWKTTPLMA